MNSSLYTMNVFLEDGQCTRVEAISVASAGKYSGRRKGWITCSRNIWSRGYTSEYRHWNNTKQTTVAILLLFSQSFVLFLCQLPSSVLLFSCSLCSLSSTSDQSNVITVGNEEHDGNAVTLNIVGSMKVRYPSVINNCLITRSSVQKERQVSIILINPLTLQKVIVRVGSQCFPDWSELDEEIKRLLWTHTFLINIYDSLNRRRDSAPLTHVIFWFNLFWPLFDKFSSSFPEFTRVITYDLIISNFIFIW